MDNKMNYKEFNNLGIKPTLVYGAAKETDLVLIEELQKYTPYPGDRPAGCTGDRWLRRCRHAGSLRFFHWEYPGGDEADAGGFPGAPGSCHPCGVYAPEDVSLRLALGQRVRCGGYDPVRGAGFWCVLCVGPCGGTVSAHQRGLCGSALSGYGTGGYALFPALLRRHAPCRVPGPGRR